MLADGTCERCLVRNRALCASLSEEEFELFKSAARLRHMRHGQTVCWAGEENVVFANVVHGMLKISATSIDGREQVVGLLHASDFVGHPFTSTTHFTVSALTDVTLCVLPRAVLERLVVGNARMERSLYDRTLASLDEARMRIFALSRRSASERVAGFLLSMADQSVGIRCRVLPEGAITFDLPLSRGQIADVLGLNLETVSRQLTRLKQAGVIALPGGRALTIVKRAELCALSDAA